MGENINGARDSLLLQALLPEGCEGENAVGIAIQIVEEGLVLRGVDLVAVDPDLEGAGQSGLTNLLHEAIHHAQIIVNHDDMRALATDNIGQGLVAEALLGRLLEGGGVNHLYAGRIGAKIGMHFGELLESEMRGLEPWMTSQLAEDSVAHF